MTRNTLGGILSIAVGGVVLTLIGPREDVLARSHEILAAPEAAAFACTGYCVACLYDPGHAADVAPPECSEDPELCQNMDADEGGGWHTFCTGANNCGNHDCRDSFASAEEIALDAAGLLRLVTDAVHKEDAEVLQRLLRANPKRATYVSSREAVQITACDGEVVAHYPIPKRVAEAFSH